MKTRLLQDYRGFALISIALQGAAIVALKHAANVCASLYCARMHDYYALAALAIAMRVLTWNQALARATLAKVYVFTALQPVILMGMSTLILGESISAISVVGALIIVFATWVSQRSSGNEQRVN